MKPGDINAINISKHNDNALLVLETGGASKMDEFSESFKGGRGLIVNPKIYVADFGPLKQGFWSMKFKKNAT